MTLPPGPVEAASVTVRGTLRWPADAAAQLTTGFLVAEGPAGAVRIGTAAQPAAPGSAVQVVDNGRAHSALGPLAVGAGEEERGGAELQRVRALAVRMVARPPRRAKKAAKAVQRAQSGDCKREGFFVFQ